MELLWVLLAVAYIAALALLGMQTLSKGHKVLFFVGILFPVLWIVGAVIAPTPGSYAAASRS